MLFGSAMNRRRQPRFTCMRTCSSRSVHLPIPIRPAWFLVGIGLRIASSPFWRVSDYADCMQPPHPCSVTRDSNVGIIRKSAFRRSCRVRHDRRCCRFPDLHLREPSAGVRRSEAVSLCHPVVPVFNSLATVIREELLDQTAGETPRCVIVRMPTPPSAGTLLARMPHRATQLAHS